jgi:pimeloyl-ACP methyl ester carboxylesterase
MSERQIRKPRKDKEEEEAPKGTGDFGSAISALCEEKGISKEKVIESIEKTRIRWCSGHEYVHPPYDMSRFDRVPCPRIVTLNLLQMLLNVEDSLIPESITYYGKYNSKEINYSYKIQVDIIEDLLKQKKVDNLIVVAHDYGVTAAQEMMSRALDRKKNNSETYNLKGVIFLNGGIFPESHKPRIIQSILASSFGKYLAPFIDAPIQALENYSDTIEKEKLQTHLRGIQQQLLTTPANKKEVNDCANFLDDIDKRRNRNWRAIFPQIVEIVNTINKEEPDHVQVD